MFLYIILMALLLVLVIVLGFFALVGCITNKILKDYYIEKYGKESMPKDEDIKKRAKKLFGGR